LPLPICKPLSSSIWPVSFWILMSCMMWRSI